MSCSDRDDECCPITLVPFRTITAARTTFLPCCHRFDSDAIRHYIDQCLARARAGRATVATSVPCPVCRCRVPPDYLADMGVPVTWPPRAPVAAAPLQTNAPTPSTGAPAPVSQQTRRSARPSRPVAPVVIVIPDDDDDSEEMHERTAQWIGSDDDDDDDDDSTGSLDDFIVDDDHDDPDADYVPRAEVPAQSAVVSDGRSGGASDGDDDDDDDESDCTCSCSTDEEDI